MENEKLDSQELFEGSQEPESDWDGITPKKTQIVRYYPHAMWTDCDAIRKGIDLYWIEDQDPVKVRKRFGSTYAGPVTRIESGSDSFLEVEIRYWGFEEFHYG